MVFAINSKTDAFDAFVAKAKLFNESDLLKNGTAGWNLTSSTSNTTATSHNSTNVISQTHNGKRSDEAQPVRLYGRGGGSVLRRRWW